MRQSRRAARLFIENSLRGDTLSLTRSDAHYLANVLRLRAGDEIIAFNGRGQEWHATIEVLSRRRSVLKLTAPATALAESPLTLTLIQGLVKAEAMDAIIQKATELGVSAIYPALTEFSIVRLDAERLERRLEHWRRIARSACEQSGRHAPPEIHGPAPLETCLNRVDVAALKLALDPLADEPPALPSAALASVAAVVGPEGGFGQADLTALEGAGCLRIRLGGRVLRADTAAIAICALAQQRWGDLR